MPDTAVERPLAPVEHLRHPGLPADTTEYATEFHERALSPAERLRHPVLATETTLLTADEYLRHHGVEAAIVHVVAQVVRSRPSEPVPHIGRALLSVGNKPPLLNSEAIAELTALRSQNAALKEELEKLRVAPAPSPELPPPENRPTRGNSFLEMLGFKPDPPKPAAAPADDDWGTEADFEADVTGGASFDWDAEAKQAASAAARGRAILAKSGGDDGVARRKSSVKKPWEVRLARSDMSMELYEAIATAAAAAELARASSKAAAAAGARASAQLSSAESAAIIVRRSAPEGGGAIAAAGDASASSLEGISPRQAALLSTKRTDLGSMPQGMPPAIGGSGDGSGDGRGGCGLTTCRERRSSEERRMVVDEVEAAQEGDEARPLSDDERKLREEQAAAHESSTSSVEDDDNDDVGEMPEMQLISSRSI